MPVTLPPLLRAASAAILAVIGVRLAMPGEREATVLTVGPDGVSALATALVAPAPPAHIVWAGATPSAAEALLLAPGPGTPALTLPVGPPPPLRVAGPERPIAGRAAVLDVGVRGRAGEAVTVRWHGAVGHGDSATVPLDQRGGARAGLGVRPTRSGWQAWTVSAAADSVTVAAWARPARPLRIHALVGTPDPESRYALRALEEAGAEVRARVELGRVVVDDARVDPDAADVVLLLGDPETDAEARARLLAFVAAGGGVVIAPGTADAGGDGAARPLLQAWGVGAERATNAMLARGDSVRWTLPASLSPLPPAPAPVRVTARTPAGSARAVAHVDGRPVALLAAAGLGRVAWTGIGESWRWRMEGGAVEAHRAWWRGLVEWAASGVREPIVARAPATAVAGSVVTVRFEAMRPAGARWPDSVELTRPDGRVEPLAVAPAHAGPAGSDPGAPRRARFLADAAGEYRIAWNDGGEVGLRVDAGVPAPDPAALSLLALASGADGDHGYPSPPGGDSDAPGRIRGTRPWSPDGHRPPPAALGVALAALLLAEWALRRRVGGP